MLFRQRLALILSLCLLLALPFWIRTFFDPQYENLAALQAAQEKIGFVQIGRFGTDWPASIIEEQDGFGQISFTRRNGQPHTYRKFDGYRLKMIRLKGRTGDEVIVVFRSATTESVEAMEEDQASLIRKVE